MTNAATPTHRRYLRPAKWGGTVISILIIATWLITVPAFTKKQLSVHRISPSGSIGVVDGTIQITSGFFKQSPTVFFTNWHEGLGYYGERVPFGLGLPVISRSTNGKRTGTIPLWVPLFLVAIPTLFLWDRDRRPKHSGLCAKCNYNLTGNTSGICPECGTTITQGRSGRSPGCGMEIPASQRIHLSRSSDEEYEAPVP